MTFTYADTPASVIRDAIRLEVGDTDELPDRSLSDGEITYFAARYGLSDITATPVGSEVAVLWAAVEACEALAGKLGKDAHYSAGGMSVEANLRASSFRTRAKALRKRARAGVGIKVFGRVESDKTTAAGQGDTVKAAFQKDTFQNE